MHRISPVLRKLTIKDIGTPYTLGKNERLKSRKLIGQLFKEGNNFQVFPFRVYYLYIPSMPNALQAGFSVSSKTFKKAVDRNRIKRVMREAYRLQKHPLDLLLTSKSKCLAVFIIYTSREMPESSLAHDKMATVLQKIVNKIDEVPASNT